MDALTWTAQQRDLRWMARSSPPSREQAVGGGEPPTASVIVVCWNAAEVLERCLDQLLAQDYPDYEVVVVDDGSQDETLAVARRAAARNSAVKAVRSARNLGAPHARNLGVSHATGEIIAFIDADGFAAPDWLRRVVIAFDDDESIGAVASTVFFATNPQVINGAGGTVNRQGWAADLAMNRPFEGACVASEALYPMGCGMALRRSVLDDVGPFDDRMLNYYDDVDYGMRVWRAGYRVVVARDAWVDHGFGGSGSPARRKLLLCERHRMRVVLKNAPGRVLARWAAQEARETRRAPWPRRFVKLKAMGWNVLHLSSVLGYRWRLRQRRAVPDRLVDPSWGDGFPMGVPPISRPRPENAVNVVDMTDPRSEEQLLYGWFPTEHVDGRSYRWAAPRAALLVHLESPATRLRLDYAHVPIDTGGVDLRIRRAGSPDPLAPIWATHLVWLYMARSVENHRLTLPPGDYEVVFSAREGWPEPPLRARELGFALASIYFEESYDVAPGGLDMASADVERQLVSGWFEAEQSPERVYRWASGHAAAVVHLTHGATSIRLGYSMPPAHTGHVTLSMYPAESPVPVWSGRIAWHPGGWRERSFEVSLGAGEYVIAFDSGNTWSNPDQHDRAFPPENRSLGFALSSLSFVEATEAQS